MKLVKCPRCELNYITEEEKYCKVCLRDLKGIKPEEEVEMCSVCNAQPALPGRDVCLSCLKEINGPGEEDSRGDTLLGGHVSDPMDLQSSVDTMEEIIPSEDDITEDEDYKEMDKELSLQDLMEQEEEEEEDEDPEEI